MCSFTMINYLDFLGWMSNTGVIITVKTRGGPSVQGEYSHLTDKGNFILINMVEQN